jgi:hypothetical protein
VKQGLHLVNKTRNYIRLSNFNETTNTKCFEKLLVISKKKRAVGQTRLLRFVRVTNWIKLNDHAKNSRNVELHTFQLYYFYSIMTWEAGCSSQYDWLLARWPRGRSFRPGRCKTILLSVSSIPVLRPSKPPIQHCRGPFHLGKAAGTWRLRMRGSTHLHSIRRLGVGLN